MQAIKAFFNSLTPAQNVVCTIMIGIVLGLFVVLILLQLSEDRPPKITNLPKSPPLPSESDLRKHDEEMARRAYIRYTGGKLR